MNTSIENIKTLIIDNKKNFKHKELLEYLYSMLEINNIDFSSTSFIHLSHLENLSQYQVILFDKDIEFTIIDIFKVFYSKSCKLDNNDLFLADNFFVIYRKQKFYYVQKIDYEINLDDLKKYILQMLKIKIDNIYSIDSNTMLDLENKYNEKYKNTSLLNINYKKDKSFKIYSLYIITCALLLITYYFYMFENENRLSNALMQENKKDYERFVKANAFNGLEDEFDEILNNIKKNKLKLHDFKYEKNYISLTFESKKKENIYNFLDFYRKRINKSSITLDVNSNLYRCLCDVKIYR